MRCEACSYIYETREEIINKWNLSLEEQGNTLQMLSENMNDKPFIPLNQIVSMEKYEPKLRNLDGMYLPTLKKHNLYMCPECGTVRAEVATDE